MRVTFFAFGHNPPMEIPRYLEPPVREDLAEKLVLVAGPRLVVGTPHDGSPGDLASHLPRPLWIHRIPPSSRPEAARSSEDGTYSGSVSPFTDCTFSVCY